jgi:hypothetical protein
MQPVLRGRKLYWHRRNPFAPPPPNANLNVQAKYFPLQSGTRFVFEVSFERLDATELGALIEALDFPAGAAHKLGLGKPFGLGSVRIDIDWSSSEIQQDQDRYRCLGSRFRRPTECTETQQRCRACFRSAVSRGRGDFESLEHVRAFRAMTSFEQPRDPRAIGYMELKAPNETASYRMKPILLKPLQIPKE